MAKVHIPRSLYWQTRLFSLSKGFWQRLGELETRILREEIQSIDINKPVYICGLARAGTTILTELLNEHPQLTSHRYSDFPFTFVPFWKNWLRQRSQLFKPQPQERAHGDRIMVTPDSPEAIEEVIWMHFFKCLHLDEHNQILDHHTSNPEFEAFYQNHIRKLLLVRKTERYLCKGNYNVSRVRYILKLFPEARFIFLVRHPTQQIASLQKQHQLFLDENNHPSKHHQRVSRQLTASGHFEFGLNRKAINIDPDQYREIVQYWNRGQEVKGWALSWDQIYKHVVHLLDDKNIAANCMLVRYEDFCADSEQTITNILKHCELNKQGFEATIQKYVHQLTPPDYYQHSFSAEQHHEIAHYCHHTAKRISYDFSHQNR